MNTEVGRLNLYPIIQQAINSIQPVEVKALYESNADTNAFTDAEKAKLVNVPTDTNQEITDINLAITAINTLLASDDVNLDELQEMVNFIKANNELIDGFSLDNITEGLVNKYYTDAEKTKLALLSVTEETDIDDIVLTLATLIQTISDLTINHSDTLNRDATDSHPATAISYGETTVESTLDSILTSTEW